MSLSELFTVDEQNLLRLSFEFVFNHIADVDSNIDKREVLAFDNFVAKYKKFDSVIGKEILKDYNIDVMNQNYSEQNLSNQAGLRKISELLDIKVDRDTAVDFKKLLIAFGFSISNSSGSLFDHKVSHDEEDALNEVGFALNISVRDMFMTGEIQKLFLEHK